MGPSAPLESNPPRDTDGNPRRARPNIPRRESIGDYPDREIQRLIEWIGSDGCLRTDEEMIDELLPELGFSRRGTRIEATLREAVEAYRARRTPGSEPDSAA